jgi:Holliday junction resolvase RusA-like endonuclease
MTEVKIVIPGQPITKKNSQIPIVLPNGRGMIIQSKGFRRYEKDCLRELMTYSGPRNMDMPIWITVKYWLRNRRSRPDLINLIAATSDILEKAGIVVNDRQFECWDGSEIVGISPNNPRVEITIRRHKNQIKDLFNERS